MLINISFAVCNISPLSLLKLTSGQECLCAGGWRQRLPLLPDGDHDDGVAGGNADGRDDKERDGDEGHVELPVPGLGEVYPALGAELLGLVEGEEPEDGQGEGGGGEPGCQHQPAGPLPASAEVHGVGDGIVAVDTQGHQHVGRAVRHEELTEPDCRK